jgi:hypothetical protein
MYRVAVATFATLCERTSTSLFAPFEWSLGDVQQNDPIIQCGMANAIKELGTAYTIFCKNFALEFLSLHFPGKFADPE